MRSLQPLVMVPQHTRPIAGEKIIMDTLTAYRDAIQFVRDQTIRYMNKGLSFLFIISWHILINMIYFWYWLICLHYTSFFIFKVYIRMKLLKLWSCLLIYKIILIYKNFMEPSNGVVRLYLANIWDGFPAVWLNCTLSHQRYLINMNLSRWKIT